VLSTLITNGDAVTGFGFKSTVQPAVGHLFDIAIVPLSFTIYLQSLLHLAFWEQVAEICKIMLRFVSPGGHSFLKIVLLKTEANEFKVGNII